jgi:Sec-independent protein secretion pathway component TatC
LVSWSAAVCAGQHRVIYTAVFEAFFVQIKVASSRPDGLFPIIASQMAVRRAGLYSRERRAFRPSC